MRWSIALALMLLVGSPAHAVELRGSVADIGVRRITVTRPIEPESFPDLAPEAWPTGAEVLQRWGANEIAQDVLRQQWPSTITRAMLDRPDAGLGFLVRDSQVIFAVDGATVNGAAANDALDAAVQDVMGWFVYPGIPTMGFKSRYNMPERDWASSSFLFQSPLFDPSREARIEHMLTQYPDIYDRRGAAFVADNVDVDRGCSAMIAIEAPFGALRKGWMFGDPGRFPDDPDRSAAFVRRCLWAGSFHQAGFPFSTDFAAKYGADLYPIAVAATSAINGCAQTYDPAKRANDHEQLPDAGCVANQTVRYLRRD